jgi:hypothetical protein
VVLSSSGVSSLASRAVSCLILLFAAGLFTATVQVQAVAAPHFRTPAPLPAGVIGGKVLSEAEGGFIITLPEIRVGIPMPEARPCEVLARLFAPFATADRGEGALPAPEGSTSLGLVICRQLAGLMGGSITLDSGVGRSTEVHFEIPMPEASAARARAPRQGVLLLCDDNAVSRMLLAETQSRQGYRVDEAADADMQTLQVADAAFLLTPVDAAKLLSALVGLGVQPAARSATPAN